MCDLLWSDPDDRCGWGISPRGAGYTFGQVRASGSVGATEDAAGLTPGRWAAIGGLSTWQPVPVQGVRTWPAAEQQPAPPTRSDRGGPL